MRFDDLKPGSEFYFNVDGPLWTYKKWSNGTIQTLTTPPNMKSNAIGMIHDTYASEADSIVTVVKTPTKEGSHEI